MMYPREYLYRFLQLTQNRQFAPFHWCWPGRHQPLFSVTALIQHLEDSPDDPLAGETRRLVDLAIYMCAPSQPDEGIVARDEGDIYEPRPLHGGGADTWRFIRNARKKVWSNMGNDPSVLRCPNRVQGIKFGAGFDENGTTDLETGGRDDFDAAFEDFVREWSDIDEHAFVPTIP